ncbi:PIG-L family deacetylase [Permianibacter sp. IMCC34836]|uniref:PIG-L family deacetylase n=1 Tax=Permianibacter fluminis TaxID=2738515 RepID=UPI0015567318|nr:PIG-L family deacetylase [Permianibacter fluminis]NQD35776.1 PIG-L family deacetylase [Permianibacter fluminis]
MKADKQTLLRQHRQRKRFALLLALIALIALALAGLAWLLPLLALLGWVLNEAFFSDHLFYSPSQDYRYDLHAAVRLPVQLANGRLHLNAPIEPDVDTWLLAIQVRGSWFSRWRDPLVRIYTADSQGTPNQQTQDARSDQQTFERGSFGLRYLNLSDFRAELAAGQLQLSGLHCTFEQDAVLYGFRNADYRRKRTLILAPHADDAELAAFGFYQSSAETSIVTVTVGELEADAYQAFGLAPAQAAELKARLRVWDSQAIPQWAGIPAERCFQLGYFCLQLRAMQQAPEQSFGSRVAPLQDVRPFRRRNSQRLPADANGEPTWRNLVADLRALLETLQPEVVITPHPVIDPHSDHVACTAALNEAIQLSQWQPQYQLHYANHLHDNDRWPMGNAHDGVTLPPAVAALPVSGLWSLSLDRRQQIDKAMALAMMHDLQPRLPLKKRLRRLLQRGLAGRRWPAFGDSEFFRKAVRRHELFFVQPATGTAETGTAATETTAIAATTAAESGAV